MKTAITLALLAALTATSTLLNAQQYQMPFHYSNQAWQNRLDSQRYQYNPHRYAPTQSIPNVFGGEDFYNRYGYQGRSMPNVFGGRDFYRR